MRYLLALLVLMFANAAQAIDCHTPPSCESLGYSKTPETNCAANGFLNCPFDPTYKKCVLHNCETLGYTLADKTSWCAEIVPCKEDGRYTLCEDPCFAWDYDRLSTLANSDKCKVVTVMQDINIPDGSKVYVHEGVTIDGGSHTINTHGTQKGYAIFHMKDETGLKNINFVHHHVGDHKDLRLINVDKIDQAITDEMVYLENVNIHIESEGTPSGETGLLFRGNYTFTGNFDWYLSASDKTGGFKNFSGKRIFKNAHMKAFTDGGSGAALNGNYYSFEDSRFDLVMGEHKKVNSNVLYSEANKDYYKPLVMKIKNSTVTFTKLSGRTIFYNTNPEPMKIKVLEGGNLNFVANQDGDWNFVGNNTTTAINIYLSGTENNPAKITMAFVGGKEKMDPKKMLTIITSNFNDRFTLNGKTYRPVVLGSTLLQELETSPNWQVVQ